VASYEVPQTILNSPYDEPRWHWWIEEGQLCEKREGRGIGSERLNAATR
jgi:hypothetical protein